MNYPTKQKKEFLQKTPFFIDQSIDIVFNNNWTIETRNYRDRYIKLKWNSIGGDSFHIGIIQYVLDNVICLVCETYIIPILRNIPEMVNRELRNQQLIRNICYKKYKCLVELNDIVEIITQYIAEKNITTLECDFGKAMQLIFQFKEFTFSGCCSPSCREIYNKKSSQI